MTESDSEKPTIQDHETATGSLKYELGRAELQHPTNFVASEFYCYEDSDIDKSEFRTTDWLLPVYASQGRLVLKADVDPEPVFIKYDGNQLVVLLWNETFSDYRPTNLEQDDVEDIVERASEIDLQPHHESEFDTVDT